MVIFGAVAICTMAAIEVHDDPLRKVSTAAESLTLVRDRTMLIDPLSVVLVSVRMLVRGR
jgi:hypothetical protein